MCSCAGDFSFLKYIGTMHWHCHVRQAIDMTIGDFHVSSTLRLSSKAKICLPSWKIYNIWTSKPHFLFLILLILHVHCGLGRLKNETFKVDIKNFIVKVWFDIIHNLSSLNLFLLACKWLFWQYEATNVDMKTGSTLMRMSCLTNSLTQVSTLNAASI